MNESSHRFTVKRSWRVPGAKVAVCACGWTSMPSTSEKVTKAALEHLGARQ